MMIKPTLLFACLFICFGAFTDRSYGQVEPRDYRLTGKILSVKMEEDSSIRSFKLRISFELANVSHRPLLLVKQYPPTFVGLDVARDESFDSGMIIESFRGGPSISGSPRWARLRDRLDRSAPSDEVVRKIPAGGFWRFEYDMGVVAEKRDSGRGRLTVAHLATPVWIKVHLESWSFNLERDPSADSSKLPLGHKLQARFRDHGVLLVNDLVSEPIQLHAGTLASSTFAVSPEAERAAQNSKRYQRMDDE